MPYEIRKEDDKWCVFNKESGERKACHDSEEQAEAQVRLLHELEKEE